MDLPSEVLHIIFSYLPRHYLRHCPQVCRLWYPVAQTLLYDTVEFYNQHQLIKFIETRQQQALTTSGHYVQTIRFHFYLTLEKSILDYLQRVCPNVKAVSSSLTGRTPETIRPWLTEKWKNLRSLTVNPLEDSNSSWHSVADKLTQLYIVPLRGLHNTARPDLRMSDIMPARFLSLVELSVRFFPLNPSQFDGAFLDHLASSCPSLTTLTLANMHYPDAISVDNSTVIHTVTSLRISITYNYEQVDFFDSYTKVFPNLTCLDVEINPNWTDNWHEEDNRAHRMALYKLITGFQQLASLRLRVMSADLHNLSSMADVLPSRMISDWIVGAQLTSLTWPDCSLFRSSTTSYLGHLTSLAVDIKLNWTPTDMLRFLLYNNTQSTIPPQLAKLKLSSKTSLENNPFDLSAWAKASPRLKELTIKGLDIVNRINSNGSRNRNADRLTDQHCEKEDGRVHCFSQLESLRLTACGIAIKSEDELTSLTRHFPSLKRFHCELTRWSDGNSRDSRDLRDQKMEKPLTFTIDASHWALDQLYLSRMMIFKNTQPRMVKEATLIEDDGRCLRVREVKLDVLPRNRRDWVDLLLRLKSVNHIAFTS